MGVHMQRIENQIETYDSWDTGKSRREGGGGGENFFKKYRKIKQKQC